MRKLLAALTFLILASVPACPQFLTPGIVIAGSPPPTSCTTTEQFALNPTPNGCNLALFNQGLIP
jgi:hypothetical protein